ncbi:MAG: type II toxin-antitoxin system RelE/ParE family toxin [bacterium]
MYPNHGIGLTPCECYREVCRRRFATRDQGGLPPNSHSVTIYGTLPVTDPIAPWQVEFYERVDGGCPVEDFLNGLDRPARAKVLGLIQFLADQGPTLPFPYSSQVRGKIRELRTHTGERISACCTSGRQVASGYCCTASRRERRRPLSGT